LGVRGLATGSTYRVTLAAVHVDAVSLAGLTAGQKADLATLVRRADEADDHPPLPEPQRLALTGEAEEPTESELLLVHDDGGELVACAVLSSATDRSVSVHVVLDPDRRRDDRYFDALVGRALEEAEAAGAPSVHLWAFRAADDDDRRARRLGFSIERDVLQLRVPLPLPQEVRDSARPVVTRPFVLDRDEEAWLHTNNRAFAGHPEQGAWTRHQLDERLRSDWVDLEGFLVADAPAGAGLIGSCWTKVHRDRDPALGEIYVIAVDPDHHGQGWGRALTVAGLDWLAGRGVSVGMLYTEADNTNAVSLYRSLGFTLDHVDRSYRRHLHGVEDGDGDGSR
jgi:mycothiol synthase